LSASLANSMRARSSIRLIFFHRECIAWGAEENRYDMGKPLNETACRLRARPGLIKFL